MEYLNSDIVTTDTDLCEDTEQNDSISSQTSDVTFIEIAYDGIVKTLSRSNLGRIIIQAINKAKLKIHERRIKATIKEMVSNNEITTVQIDVFDELCDETPLCTIDIDCETVEDDLCPGEVIDLTC